jgi:hypothetical protein
MDDDESVLPGLFPHQPTGGPVSYQKKIEKLKPHSQKIERS